MTGWGVFSRKAFGGGTSIAAPSVASRPPADARPTAVEVRDRIAVEARIFVAAAGESEHPTLKFEPGRQYRLTVYLEHRAAADGSFDCFHLYGNTLRLELSCDWEGLIIRRAPNSTRGPVHQPSVVHLGRDELSQPCRVAFTIAVPEDCPKRRVRLELKCCDLEGFSDHPYQGPVVAVELDGRRYEATVSQRESWNIALDAEIPSNWAILHIVEAQDGRLQLRGWNRDLPPEESPIELEKPQLEECDWVEHPAQVIGWVVSCSDRSMGALHRWINQLLVRNPENLVFVLVEHAETSFPWEMIRLDDGYLGSRAEIVRWLNIELRGHRSALTPEAEQYSGQVLAFLGQETSETQLEEAELAQLACSRLATLDDLVVRLHERRLEGVGLIYLGCHGLVRYGQEDSVRYLKLGELDNPSKQMVDLELGLLQPLLKKVPLVLVNACHSGRLYRDERGVYGLPAVFLNLAAKSYVGTLGPVADLCASRFGAEIVRRLRTAVEGVGVSRVLRQLRAEAADNFGPLTRSYEDHLEFLTRFAYVHYGNPLSCLRLEPASRAKAEM